MKTVLSLPMLAALLSGTATVRSDGHCDVTELSQIYLKEVQLLEAEIESKRTYTICPNATYSIGTGMSIEDYNGTNAPLVLFYPNVEILCGADGNATEGPCMLSGGSAQVAFITPFMAGVQLMPMKDTIYDLENMHFKGLTFSSPSSSGVGITSNTRQIPGQPLVGDFTFEDCDFMGFDNQKMAVLPSIDVTEEPSAMPSDVPSAMPSGVPSAMPSVSMVPTQNQTDGRMRRLTEENEHSRRLNGHVSDVTFKHCNFMGSKAPEVGGFIEADKLTIEGGSFNGNNITAGIDHGYLLGGKWGADIKLDGVQFDKNLLGGSLASGESFPLIYNNYGTMEIKDSSFTDNTFYPAILMNEGGTVDTPGSTASGNTAGGGSAQTTCEGGYVTISSGTFTDPISQVIYGNCTAFGTTDAPTKTPTKAPTSGASALSKGVATAAAVAGFVFMG